VFTFSERANTEAAEKKGVVPVKERKRRNKMLRILSAKKRRAFYESQLGNTLEVLFEGENKKGYITGYTQNYVRVKTFWNPEWVNTTRTITLKAIDEDGLVRFEEPRVEDSPSRSKGWIHA
jgi:threonylcarbamoyladenosine tRNA methylthiotransferase MtaB